MIKIIVLCVLAGFIIIFVKNYSPEISMTISVVTGCIVITYALSYLTQTFNFINEIIEKSSVEKEYFIIIFKAIAIGYLIEFGAGILSDFGINNVADKLVFLGKIIIFSMSLPIVYAIFNVVQGLLL